MFEKKLNLKILTSIFIVLFFIVFLHSSCYATYIEDLPAFTTFKNSLENNSTFNAQKDNYSNIIIGYLGYSNNSGSHLFWVIMSNNSTINFTYSTETQKYVQFYNNNNGYYANNCTSSYINLTQSQGNINFYVRDGYSNYSNMLERFNDNVYFYKLSSPITFNGNEVINPPSTFDFSFTINDHNFDLNMEDFTFNNGVTLSSDDLKDGQYIVSLQSFVKNTYYNDYTNYWAQGFIDYYPYSNSNPDQYFFMSTGYNTLSIRNSLNDNSYFYRFYFKGYSSDSSFTDDTYNIVSSTPDNYDIWRNYFAPNNNTFIYSNRDIYWGNDSSLYGFTSLSNNIYFDSSIDPDYSISDYPVYTYSNRDSEQESTTFAIGNNVYNYPSTSATINHNDLFDYSNNPISNVSNYGSFSNDNGDNLITEDTSNWTTLDYLKNIPNQLAKIPNLIGKALSSLFIPNHAQLVDLYTRFQDFSTNHLGVLNAPISFIMEFLGDISTKYNENYSYYPFTIPGFRWFNMVTGQKETIIESRTIDLNTYFLNDEDWFFFWNSLRMIVSVLIFINIIVMLFNLYQRIIHGQPARINNPNIGDLSRKE